MKKILSGLVLASLFAVLLVPVMASAAFVTCSSSCATKVTTDCLCNGDPVAAGTAYCNGYVYLTQSDCQAGQGSTGGATGQQQIPGATINSVGDLVSKIQTIGNWVFTGLLALAAIFLVVAGYYFVIAGGDPEKIKTARQMIINALIGVAVGLAAKGLIMVIQSIVGTNVSV